MWLRLFQHLLPKGRAWRITTAKNLRNFFEGLTGVGSEAKAFIDVVYEGSDPQKTIALTEWEAQFVLPNTNLTDGQRRDRLEATWKALGGQSPRYIQDTLQAAGFDVYVHEWWEPIGGRPNGGSINGDVTPVARDPFTYLDDGSNPSPWIMLDGGADAMDGGADAMDGSTVTPVGYPLVNKILIAKDTINADGTVTMQDGNAAAMDGYQYTVNNYKQYLIPSDPTKYPHFLYIGGEVFPDRATVPTARRDEFEDLCLKICPAEQWLGVIVNYS